MLIQKLLLQLRHKTFVLHGDMINDIIENSLNPTFKKYPLKINPSFDWNAQVVGFKSGNEGTDEPLVLARDIICLKFSPTVNSDLVLFAELKTLNFLLILCRESIENL